MTELSCMLSGRNNSDLEKFDLATSVLDALHAVVSLWPICHAVYHASNIKQSLVDQPYVRATYSDKWITRYLLHGYVSIDPIVKRGFNAHLPFFWNEVEFTDPKVLNFLEDAQAYNVGISGLSIPIIDKQGRRALFSASSHMAPDDFYKIMQREIELLAQCAHIIHKRVIEEELGQESCRPMLSPRETECLKWVARGKDAQAVAIILDISDHTVRDYLKSAKNKLGAITLPQAIHKATFFHLIESEEQN